MLRANCKWEISQLGPKTLVSIKETTVGKKVQHCFLTRVPNKQSTQQI